MIINILFVALLIILCIARCSVVLKKTVTMYVPILLTVIVLVHFLLFFLHFKYELIRPVDSKHFFNLAKESIGWFNMFGTGNRSIPFIIRPFTKIGLSYFSISFMFSVISFIGYLIYFKILTKDISNKNRIEKIVIAIFFLIPSIHFWTVSINKEAIIFFLMAVIFKKVYSDKINSWLLILSILIILFIRPYLAVILMFPIIVLNFKKFSTTYKIIIGFVTMVSIPIVLSFLRITGLESFKLNYYKIAEYANNNGNSSIDLLDSYYIERVLLVLFRPFFFDAKTPMQYYVSVENVLWLILFIVVVFLLKNFKKVIKDHKFNFIFIYLTVIVSFYGIYMYNLGLASRMRVLFVPYSILLLLLLIKQELKIKRGQ